MAASLADKLDRDRATLSARDQAICDAFISGTSRKVLAEQQHLTMARIGQILNRPDSVAYMLQRGAQVRSQLFARVGMEILARTELGGLRLADLLAIWKAAMPQEVAITQTVIVRQEARRIADELGLSVDDVLAEAEALVAGARA